MTLSHQMKQDTHSLMRKLTKSNKKETLSKIRKMILKDNPKPRTQTIRFSQVKKLFRGVTEDTEFLKEIRPDPKITTEILSENNKTRDQRKLITIDKDLVHKILDLENSSNVYDVAIYLLFVSGRRVAELATARFFNLKNSPMVQISGVKKRSDNITCQFMPLVNKSKFFKTLRRYKKLPTSKNNEAFHRGLNRRIKKLWPNENYKPHTFRGMYVTYAFEFRNTKNSKINTFIQETLCHQSINASLNYTQYKLSDDFRTDIVKIR